MSSCQKKKKKSNRLKVIVYYSFYNSELLILNYFCNNFSQVFFNYYFFYLVFPCGINLRHFHKPHKQLLVPGLADNIVTIHAVELGSDKAKHSEHNSWDIKLQYQMLSSNTLSKGAPTHKFIWNLELAEVVLKSACSNFLLYSCLNTFASIFTFGGSSIVYKSLVWYVELLDKLYGCRSMEYLIC